MLHLEGKLFESLRCLVLVRKDCIGSSKFTIYQMRKACSVWSKREEDSFIIINLSAKVVQYNLISKTPREIYDMGSNEIADDYLHGFIPPYAMYDVGYKKLDYKVDYILVMMSEEPNTNAQETYAPPHKVLTNHDLLTEIFIRLHILSIHLFTCVSKQWLKILKSPAFTLKRSQIRSLDSPVGLFVNHIRSSFDCDFVSLDPRINSRKYTIENSFTLGSTEEAGPKKSPYYKVVHAFDFDKVTILQSCNGLLLCTDSRRHAFDYVYNSSTNLLKILPKPDYVNVDSNVYGCAGLRLAFDPKNHLTTKWEIILFLVINLSGKVVEYNLISKNLREMYDMGSNQLTDDYHDGFIPPGFIPPFATYDMRPKQVDYKVYEFIPSYASV
nr:hypothetical protein [Tanacetum cinerariifolium]